MVGRRGGPNCNGTSVCFSFHSVCFEAMLFVANYLGFFVFWLEGLS